jgi:hypothetical protein
VAIISITFPGTANFATLGTESGMIYPISSKDAYLYKEDVRINCFVDSFIVIGRYWLIRTVDINEICLGFPGNTLYGTPIGSDNRPIRNLAVQVSGKSVKVNKKRTLDSARVFSEIVSYEKAGEYWYEFNAKFGKQDTLEILAAFTGEWSGGPGERFCEYLIGTARLWNHPISYGRIMFEFGNIASCLFATAENKAKNGISLKSHSQLKT